LYGMDFIWPEILEEETTSESDIYYEDEED
jgi:hypothetical protein